MTIFTMTPKKARSEIVKLLAAGLVPFLRGSPGMGKSAMLHDIADEFGLEVIDLRLSQCAPEDLN